MNAGVRRSWLAVSLLVAGCAGPSRIEERPGELPAESRVALGFAGEPSTDVRRLEEAVESILDEYEESDFRETYLDDAAFELEQFLADQGFLSARVAFGAEPIEGGRRVEFDVVEGERTELEEFRIIGVRAFDVDRVRAEFDFPEASWRDRQRRFFSPSVWRAGRTALRGRYLEAGYLDVRFSESGPQLSPDGTIARLELRVDEGVPYRLADVLLEVEGPLARDELLEMLRARVGEPYTPRLGVELRNALVERFAGAGHPDAAVLSESALDGATGDVVVSLRVVPGPLVRIGEVHVEGARRTRESFLRARLDIDSGDVYDRDQLTRAFRRLYRSGLFESVRIELADGPSAVDEAVRDLTLAVVEAKHQEVFLEPGYGSFERLRLRAGYRQRNLFGTGRGLRIEGLVAERATHAEVGVSDPQLLGSDWLGDASVYFEERERPSFTDQEAGLDLTVTWPVEPELSVAFDYSFRRSQVFDVSVDPASDPTLQEALDGVDISSIQLAPSYDSRDRLFTPAAGQFARLSLEWASTLIGSEVDFLRPAATLSGFWRLPFLDVETVLGVTVQGGIVVPIGATEEIPIQERYFNGGAQTVRAFEQDELGPKDADGSPIGGEAFQLASVELRQPLYGRLHGGLFYDVGGVATSYEDVFDLGELRGGPGLGLRYLLPVGPVRLDLAWNPDAEPGESTTVWHFSVGMAF